MKFVLYFLSICLLGIMFLWGLSQEKFPVYKLTYEDLEGNKETVFVDRIIEEGSSITFREVNSKSSKTLNTKYEYVYYRHMTYEEMEDYNFPLK